MSQSTLAFHRRCLAILVLSVLRSPVAGFADDPAVNLPKPGDVVFQTGFDAPQDRQVWSKADLVRWVKGYQETTSLCVTVPVDAAANGHMIHLPLDVTRYRNCSLIFECMAKANDVIKPKESWLGAKFMLYYESANNNGPQWKCVSNVFGSFDWRKIYFSACIPSDATGGQLSLGLQDSSGSVWFDASLPTTYTSSWANSVPLAGAAARRTTWKTVSSCLKSTAGTGPTTPTASGTVGVSLAPEIGMGRGRR